MKRAVAALLLAAAGLVGGEARASEAEEADALFEQAKARIARGDWAGACPLLKASMKKDASASTGFKIARCFEREGKLVAAAAEVQAAELLNVKKNAHRPELQAELSRLAARWLAELSRRAARVRIDLALPARVTIDGSEQRPGDEILLDPGKHQLSAEAPGHEPLSLPFQLEERESRTLWLRFSPSAPPAPLPPTTRTATSTAPALPARREGPGVAAAVLLGTGVASMAAAAYLGLHARSLVQSSAPFCNASDDCTADGVELRSRARSAQSWAIAFTAAAASFSGVAVGVKLGAFDRSRGAVVQVGGRW